MPSHCTVNPILTSLSLVNMPSDWSEAYHSLNTLLLDNVPSDWSMAQPSLTTLSLAETPY